MRKSSPEISPIMREVSAYAVTMATIKRWSAGSPIQAALDSLSALIKEHRVAAS